MLGLCAAAVSRAGSHHHSPAETRAERRGNPPRQHPRQFQSGIDPGDRQRSAQPARLRPGKGKFQALTTKKSCRPSPRSPWTTNPSPPAWYSTPAAAWARNSSVPAWPPPSFFKIADPEDEFFLVEFDSRPRLVVPLTKDTGTHRGRVDLLANPTDPPRCWTPFTWRSRRCTSPKRTRRRC